MRLTFLAIGIALFGGIGIWHAPAGQQTAATSQLGGDASDLRQHGDYLVNAAILCGDCHTPQDERGQPDRSQLLRGTTLPIQPKKETTNWADKSPDITASGLAGQWNEEAMVKFLTTGIDPNGKKARPPMPAFRLSDRDARAVSQYLMSLGGTQAGEPEAKPRPRPQP
jgi:mono/diheme cytochrome c family protein